MLEILNITKAISDENRVRALMMLADGELCVCQIIEMLGLAPSTVSKHMSLLKQARLVEIRKEGRWIYYRVNKNKAAALEVSQWLSRHLKKDAVIAEDNRHLKKIKKIDIDKISGCYRS